MKLAKILIVAMMLIAMMSVKVFACNDKGDCPMHKGDSSKHECPMHKDKPNAEKSPDTPESKQDAPIKPDTPSHNCPMHQNMKI